MDAVLARVEPGQLMRGGAHASAPKNVNDAALIDDDTATPPHAMFKLSRLATVLLVGAALWLLPMAALALAGAVALALWRLRWGVIPVIAASALAGLLLRSLGLA